VRCIALFSVGITGRRDYPAGRVVRLHKALETGVILLELAAIPVGQISIEEAPRVA
jgi:hypothetical protein